jgi:hypothetical protein
VVRARGLRARFTQGRIIVRGKLVTRGKAKRADYILYIKSNIPLALIEAKDNTHAPSAARDVGDGGRMRAALSHCPVLPSYWPPRRRTQRLGAASAALFLSDISRMASRPARLFCILFL